MTNIREEDCIAWHKGYDDANDDRPSIVLPCPQKQSHYLEGYTAGKVTRRKRIWKTIHYNKVK